MGSWIETESEIRTVLDAVDPAALSFGPDPGHLFWANADPVSLTTDYRDRVRAAHLKDVHAAAREKSRFEVSDYRQATGKNHVWTELGRGDVDLVGVLKALPDAFEGSRCARSGHTCGKHPRVRSMDPHTTGSPGRPSMSKPLGVGIIGAGPITQAIHLPSLPQHNKQVTRSAGELRSLAIGVSQRDPFVELIHG